MLWTEKWLFVFPKTQKKRTMNELVDQFLRFIAELANCEIKSS